MHRVTLTSALRSASLLVMLISRTLCAGERITVSLDGVWGIQDSIFPDQIPTAYGYHKYGFAQASVVVRNWQDGPGTEISNDYAHLVKHPTEDRIALNLISCAARDLIKRS